MTVETYGPADLYVVAFPSEHVPGQIREAVLTTLSSGVITLLDLVLVRRAADGSTEVLEIESLGEEFDLDLVQTSGSGLVGQEDIDELIEEVEPGTSVLVFLFENTWARSIAAAVRDTGAVVISAQRFPADVVNEVAELAGVSA
ncbi:hypothetical protein GCM10022204_21610 [Microlunatus aurantiacus]|uniref:DUF1269 domain-containing protein n=1 Tax=Microlunatus aurantiacus TaxID=446786 RepID=A0ABP7DGB7_9ACTN